MHRAICTSSFSGESDDSCEKNETLRYISQIINPVVEVTVDPPSWSELLRTSQNEGFSYLLYKGMIKKGVSVPPFIKESLKQEYINNWGRNIRIFEELATLLHVLGSPVIVLKGAALLFSVYENAGLRCLGDVDILVKPKDVPKIDKVLSQCGYQSDRELSCYPVTNYLNSLVYGKTGSPLLLHLHWHLINNALPNYIYAEKINMDKVWKEAIHLKIRQANVLCLAPHHQLLHLSEHAMKHSYNTLIHVWDIHQVANHWKETLDWERVCKESGEFHLKGPLFYSLWLCKEYFGTSVPNEILELLSPQRKGIGERVFFRLLRQGKRKEKLCWLFYFSNISGWQEKIAFVFRTLFPPADVLANMEGIESRGKGYLLSWKVTMRRLWKALRLFGKAPQEYED
ncbi:MAG: nucleotidyltransferase family protein [Planctomycetes bacterium]|nr:nucleotidyltransferase family protein [Planctomycetota bacterium]